MWEKIGVYLADAPEKHSSSKCQVVPEFDSRLDLMCEVTDVNQFYTATWHMDAYKNKIITLLIKNSNEYLSMQVYV